MSYHTVGLAVFDRPENGVFAFGALFDVALEVCEGVEGAFGHVVPERCVRLAAYVGEKSFCVFLSQWLENDMSSCDRFVFASGPEAL